MTEKEKALELVSKFYYSDNEIGRSYTRAIECAKIAVDEIINEWNNCEGLEDGSDGSNLYFIKAKLKYWHEVKQELEKM